MPSKKQMVVADEVKKLFEEATENSKPAWRCLLPKCNKVYRSLQASTRTRHLQDFHPNVMEAILKKVDEKMITTEDESGDDEKTIRVKISRKIVISACVEMVAKNGLPFSAINGSGFVRILNPIIDGLATSDQKLTINRNSIGKHLQDKADEVVDRIAREINGRFVSIMMDIATRQSRSILGISVQYILDDKIVIRTLAMDRLISRNTSTAIKDRVLAVLKKYGIEIQQIFAITTDNGSNMLKTTDLINDLHPTDSYDNIENVLQLLDDTFPTMPVVDNEEDELSENDEITNILQATEENMVEMQNTIASIIAESTILNCTNAVSCAAHTLQLGIGGAFDDDAFLDGSLLIRKCIKLVRTLRTKNVLSVIDRENYLRPVKHVPTRWDSSHDMVCTLYIAH